MTRLIAVCCCLLVVAPAFAQFKPDSATVAQKRIKTIEYKTFTNNDKEASGRALVYSNRLEYNAYGQLLRDETFGPDGTRTRYVIKSWHDAGMPKSSVQNGKRTDYHYRYDEFNQVIEKWEFRLDSAKHRGDTTIDRYDWDRKGNITKVERYVMGRKMVHKEYSYDKGSNMTEMRIYREGEPEPHLRTVYQYSQGKKVSAQTWRWTETTGEKLIETAAYSYNQNGLLETETHTYTTSPKDNRKRLHGYDDYNRLIVVREFAQAPNGSFDQLLSVERWEYDNNGYELLHKTPEKLIKTRYDKNGRKAYIGHFQYNYNVSREADPDPKEYAPVLRETFQYDKDGRMTTSKRYDLVVGDGSTPTMVKDYNDRGLPKLLTEVYPYSRPPEELTTEITYTYR